MKLKEYLNKQLKRSIEPGPKDDIVLSSRIRLARNLDYKVFPWRANNAVLENIWESSAGIIKRQDELTDPEVLYFPGLDQLDLELLIERHLTSYDHAASKKPRGLIISGDEKVVVMVNEEDHFRLVSILPGLNLEAAARVIDTIDNKLSQELGFAFSEQWGFLTACPTNAGTGMRASCLVHLPGLILADKIEPMLRELAKLGVVVRGLYGENTEVLGDMFQITNGPTLGRTESEVIKTVEHVVSAIINYEKNARNELRHGRTALLTEDKVYRAKAILKNARSISLSEAMSLLSKIKLGLNIGLDIPWDQEAINKLLMIIQPAHLQQVTEKTLSLEETDIVRAMVIRQRLN
ncbi:MAG: ATP--guanido phosphotransferase [Elusimicrobia bacterium]|nr:ATP--guanido phosphotransferase [Candidatus Liberimonas magnetica]